MKIQIDGHTAELFVRRLQQDASALTEQAEACSYSDWNKSQGLHRIAGDCNDLAAILLHGITTQVQPDEVTNKLASPGSSEAAEFYWHHADRSFWRRAGNC